MPRQKLYIEYHGPSSGEERVHTVLQFNYWSGNVHHIGEQDCDGAQYDRIENLFLTFVSSSLSEYRFLLPVSLYWAHR